MLKNTTNILLVEDDEVDIKTVKRAFSRNKIENPIHVAGNGLEALAMLRGEGAAIIPAPRIVVLDLNMPKMGGLEFLKKVREDPELKMLQVFVLTTSNKENEMVEAHNLNVAGYIIKPLNFEKFVEAVRTLDAFWALCEYPKE